MAKDGNSLGAVSLILLLTVFFGFGTVVFGGISIWSYQQAREAKASLQTAVQAASEQAREEQKKLDEDRFGEEQKTPFRSYLAPALYGGFEIKFPKTWNVYVVENDGATNQVDLIAHPNFIKVLTKPNDYALRVQLVRQKTDDVYKRYESLVKSGKLKNTATKVSGREAIRLDGVYDGKHNGTVVLVAVRDKTILLINEDRNLASDFNQVLEQSRINF